MRNPHGHKEYDTSQEVWKEKEFAPAWGIIGILSAIAIIAIIKKVRI